MSVHSVRVSLAMPAECRDVLNSTAGILGRSPSWVMRQLIMFYATALTRNYTAAVEDRDDASNEDDDE